jgi:trk system potassium uptake protein TrkH
VLRELVSRSQRRLGAARLAGAAVSGLLGQLAVDMPGGYFGPADSTTPEGRWYAAVVVLLAVIGGDAYLSRRRWLPLAAPALYALNVGAFIAPLASDPVVAGLALGWNLVLLGQFLFPRSTTASVRIAAAEIDAGDDLGRWLLVNLPAARHLASFALAATVAVVGFEVSAIQAVELLTLGADLAVMAILTPFLLRLARRGERLPWLPLLLVLAAAPAVARPALALSLLAGSLAVGLALLVSHTPPFRELLDHFLGRPALLVLVSFAVLIAVGTVLLSMPAAAAAGQGIDPVDAFFTATSASCVTGLIVLDTAHDLSLFGQLVVLALIQVGGLNIMVLSTFAAVLLGRGLGLRGEAAIGELLDIHATRSAYRLIVFIVGMTITIEAAGAAALAGLFLRHGMGWVDALWKGAFHSISAFCNAGFALQSDSLIPFQRDPAVLLTIGGLITLGGLGFAVLAFAWLRVAGHWKIGLAVQVRVVLVASAILVAVGWLGFVALEWEGSLAGLPVRDRLLNALFQSVTCRTAGFNSVAYDTLHPATSLLMIFLMFVGASPGGTGGGIKTTTLVVLLSAVPSAARGRPDVVLFRRRIAAGTVYRSAAIAVVAVLVVGVSAMLLFASQQGGFESILFEVVSAFGTVGLSLGATATLDGFGKVVVALVMLAGRVGPLALALLFGRSGEARVGYPEASLMVG